MNRVLLPQGISAPRALPAHAAYELRGRSMGTGWSVKLCGDLPPQPWLQQDVQRLLNRLDAQMSHWSPQSELSAFNARAAGTWQTLSPEFFDVLATALDVARDSEGALDPTLGALINLWGFGPAPTRAAPPSQAEIDAARSRSGWERVQLDHTQRRAFQPGGVELDLSCLAKGYAVDQIARRLLALDLRDFLVEVGGELRGEGCKPDGSPWWVQLEHPDPLIPRTLVALHGLAVATSGDYRQGFVHQERHYSHTLDPRSGWPTAHALASVSVIHQSALHADALATALMVLGHEAGMAYADARGVAAVLRERDGAMCERFSRAAAAMLD